MWAGAVVKGYASRRGCIFEVDWGYPKDLHELDKEYSLAPERLIVNEVKKLIPNSHDKNKYVAYCIIRI